MAISTFQKVTLTTCLVLCVALLLPKMLLSRGRKDAAERPDGHFPPMVHRQMAPEGRGQRAAGLSRAHNTEAIARAKGAGTGAGAGGKSNLAGQIIPVYGFGILFYILYILFKITSKGNSKPSEGRCASVRSDNMKRKITDFELAQLQEKLRETELMMENIVSNAHHSPDRVKGVTANQEESLLQQLTEITRVMQEGKLVEGISEEKKTQENWDDYPQESRPYWEHSHCCCQHSQQTERTEGDRTNMEGDLPDREAGEDLCQDAAIDSDVTAVSEDDGRTRKDEGENEEEEDVHELIQRAAQIGLGVPEEDLAGVLQELELTLKMTSMMEQEKMEGLTQPMETETSSSSVRRRNKRRRAKKAAH